MKKLEYILNIILFIVVYPLLAIMFDEEWRVLYEMQKDSELMGV